MILTSQHEISRTDEEPQPNAKNACVGTTRLDRASGGKLNPNGDTDLCRGTQSGNPDDAYFKVCFQENYYCQKAIETCGGGAVHPPFHEVGIGNGPPGNIGPSPAPPNAGPFSAELSE